MSDPSYGLSPDSRPPRRLVRRACDVCHRRKVKVGEIANQPLTPISAMANYRARPAFAAKIHVGIPILS